MKKNKLLIIGSNGQLGSDMVQLSKQAGFNISALDFPDIDITDATQTDHHISNFKPDYIINCSAYTAVDNCETHQKEAFAVNALGPQNIAASANKNGAVLIHISTDYVFDGNKNGPYFENDPALPQTVYGRSKLEGERFIAEQMRNYMIFRIAWLYGINGTNFVKNIRNIAQKRLEENKPLTVVNDQFGTPTYTREVCRQILSMIDKPYYGVFNCTNEGYCTWFEFAQKIVKAAGINVKLLPCTSEELARPAKRPFNSILENHRLKKLGLNIMNDWKTAFDEFLIDEANFHSKNMEAKI